MPEQLQQDFNESERLRLIESKYTLMRDRLLIINQNMIEQYKKMNKEISLLREGLIFSVLLSQLITSPLTSKLRFKLPLLTFQIHETFLLVVINKE